MQEFELDSFQADMLHMMHVDNEDPNPGMPWALDVAELIELARRKRIEHCLANVCRPRKDGWFGPVPATDRDPASWDAYSSLKSWLLRDL